MKRQPYLPDDEPGILAVLIALDDNLPGALATKYEVDASQLLRLRHGRYAYGWFITAKDQAQQWSKSLTDKHASMTEDDPAPLLPLPGLPMLPAAPTFQDGAQTITAQYEPGVFDFVGRLAGYIKGHDNYEEADGILLKIVGAQAQPPDLNIIPSLEWRFGPSGRPILIVPKMPFQGYYIWAQAGTGPVVELFSTTREFELDHPNLPMPPLGQTHTWFVQVQYRYKNEPFGQKSPRVEIPVRGV